MTTNKEKINLLKSTIEFLYTKEGRSKSYISRLLDVNRKVLTDIINEWGLIQANTSHLTPSNKKFVNKNRQLIKSRLDNNITQVSIANELNITIDKLRYLIPKDDVLSRANAEYNNRKSQIAEHNRQQDMEESSRDYNIVDSPGEMWLGILGYAGYFISNYGRVKHYIPTHNKYAMLTPFPNVSSGRLYVSIQKHNLQVSRLVGFAFVKGHTKETNTIDHKDGDIANNRASNLEWVSQADNNKRAYSNGRCKAISYAKHGKFKSIKVDGKFEFKTIRAMAKFMNISETQAHRYIDNECKCSHDIKLVY